MQSTDHLAASRHARMRWNTRCRRSTPRCCCNGSTSVRRARPGPRLRLGRVAAAGGRRRWVSGPVATRGVGVDTDDAALERGRRLATGRSLNRHVAFVMGRRRPGRSPPTGSSASARHTPSGHRRRPGRPRHSGPARRPAAVR
ncbi:hypothetical protein NKG94_08090 [Micromonospora sp. M12]